MKRSADHLAGKPEGSHSRALAYALLGAAALGAGAYAASRLRHRVSFAGKTVVITGGSRGLGLVMARQLAEEGANLVLLARTEQDLRAAECDLKEFSSSVLAIPCDVGSQTEVEAAIGLAAERFGRIDVLINNAGHIQVGPIEHMGIQDFEEVMDVHFWGSLFAMLEVIPHMRAQGEGRIVNIASIGGKVSVPHMAPYCASKFALVGLSDAMRAELARHSIRVTTVCPWFMRTGSAYNVEVKGRHQQEFAWFAAGGSVPLLTVSAERAARKIIEACRRGAPRLMMTPWGKFAAIANELTPGLIASMQKLANRMLPGPDLVRGDWSRSGWQSRSKHLPKALMRTTWEAANRNNEIPHAIALSSRHADREVQRQIEMTEHTEEPLRTPQDQA